MDINAKHYELLTFFFMCRADDEHGKDSRNVFVFPVFFDYLCIRKQIYSGK
jgi:hypothetical protein